MAEEREKCPDCGTPLLDLERRLEVGDPSHRHHAVDCVAVLRERLQTLRDVINAANDILMDTHSFDIEHALGADKAIEVLQVVIQGVLVSDCSAERLRAEENEETER